MYRLIRNSRFSPFSCLSCPYTDRFGGETNANGFDKKAGIWESLYRDSVFSSCFFFISSSSVTLFRPFRDIYTVPVLSCHSYIHSFVSFRFVWRYRMAGMKRNGMSTFERLSQSRWPAANGSPRHHFILSDVICHYILSAPVYLAIHSAYKCLAMTVRKFIDCLNNFLASLLRTWKIILLADMQISWLWVSAPVARRGENFKMSRVIYCKVKFSCIFSNIYSARILPREK